MLRTLVCLHNHPEILLFLAGIMMLKKIYCLLSLSPSFKLLVHHGTFFFLSENVLGEVVGMINRAVGAIRKSS